MKSRIEDLEDRLKVTNAKLEAALSTIGDLTTEVEALRRQHRSQSPGLRSGDKSPCPSAGLSILAQEPTVLRAAAQVARTNSPSPASSLEEQHAAPESFHTTPNLDSEEAGLVVSASEQANEDGANCNCEGFPPTAPGESTILCSSAFQIIEQQNFSGTEVTTIRAWLNPGFRKGLRPGETCRVETNRLYELLDHITSSS